MEVLLVQHIKIDIIATFVGLNGCWKGRHRLPQVIFGEISGCSQHRRAVREATRDTTYAALHFSRDRDKLLDDFRA